MATQNYQTIKNASLVVPTTTTDLGTPSQPYGNLYLQGNVTLGTTTITSSNAVTPKISIITYPGTETATDTNGGETITLTGSGFVNGCTVLLGTTTVSVVGFVSSNVLTFTAPALASGSYTVYVINPDGGTAISIPGINYSGTPNWTTASGSLGSSYEGGSISKTFVATGDVPMTYALVSGSLPSGSSLNSNGTLSGTASSVSVSTTYNFTIAAKDAQNQPTNRNFSLTINPDTVSWVSPADNTTTSLLNGTAMANITMSATSAASGTIAYTANSLPTGLSISGANIAGTPTGSGSSASLITATASPSGKTSTRTFNWVVTVSGDTYWGYTTLLLNGEGAAAANNATTGVFLDSSTNSLTVTKVNSPAQGTYSPYSASSWSNYFASTNTGYIYTPTSTSNSLGAGDYTIEFWCYSNSLGNGSAGSPFYADCNGYQQLIRHNGSVWECYYGGGSKSFTNVTIPTGTVTLNAWTHHALVRSSGTVTWYINGVSRGSGTDTTNYTASTYFQIGMYGNYYYDGYVSNVRVVKGTAVYTSAFTPSTAPLTNISGTLLLTAQSNRFIDNSGSNQQLTVYSTPSIEKFNPFNGSAVYSPSANGGSAYFNGTNDYLQIPTNTALNLGSSAYTIEAWFNVNALTGQQTIVSFLTGLKLTVVGTGLRVWGDAGNTYENATTTIIPGTWYHVAWVRESTSLGKLYLNGALILTITSGVIVSSTPTGYDVLVGTFGDGFSNYFKGYISDLRIVKGTAVYTANFTPPTAPLTAISGTSALLNFTNAGIIDQTGTSDFSNPGDGSAKISTSVKKFGTGSISFGGTGDWLAPKQPNKLLRLGGGDWTFEFWLRIPDTSKSAVWLINWNTDPRLNLDNATLAWMTAGTARITTGNVLTANTWQHIAVVKYSGNTKIYVDGTQSGSTYSDGNDYSTVNMDAIGYHPFAGYIDDFRLTKGYARYTANFTPPTSAFSTK